MTMINDGESLDTAITGTLLDTLGNTAGMAMGNGSGGMLSYGPRCSW